MQLSQNIWPVRGGVPLVSEWQGLLEVPHGHLNSVPACMMTALV